MQIDGSALKFLGNLFSFKGGQPDVNNVDPHINLVCDVSDLVRYGGAPGMCQGFFAATVKNAHVGAGTITAEYDPYVATAAMGGELPIPEGAAVWLRGLGVFASEATDYGSSAVAITYPAHFSRTVATAVMPIWGSNTIQAVGGIFRAINSGNGQYTFPLLVPRGATVTLISVGAVAGTIDVTFQLEMCALPIGTRP